MLVLTVVIYARARTHHTRTHHPRTMLGGAVGDGGSTQFYKQTLPPGTQISILNFRVSVSLYKSRGIMAELIAYCVRPVKRKRKRLISPTNVGRCIVAFWSLTWGPISMPLICRLSGAKNTGHPRGRAFLRATKKGEEKLKLRWTLKGIANPTFFHILHCDKWKYLGCNIELNSMTAITLTLLHDYTYNTSDEMHFYYQYRQT